MLEYVKVILTKVSFDRSLFERELGKATQKLVPKELAELKIWCYSRFSDTYTDILEKIFGSF